MAWLGFRTLARVAVLADFDEAPPDRVLTSVPTRGLSAVAVARRRRSAAVPLFFALPRLHGPFALAPFRVDDAFAQGPRGRPRGPGVLRRRQAQRPRRPAADLGPRASRATRSLRLREAVFTEYQDGSLDPRSARGAAAGRAGPPHAAPVPEARSGRIRPVHRPSDLYVSDRDSCSCPTGPRPSRVERGRAIEVPDGVMQVASARGARSATTRTSAACPRAAPGAARSLRPTSPRRSSTYALALTADLVEPRAIYRRIEEHFAQGFRVHARPAAHGAGRSARALPAALEGRPLRVLRVGGGDDARPRAACRARLVTGSYGGEEGLLLFVDRRARREPPRLGRGGPGRNRIRGFRSHAAGRACRRRCRASRCCRASSPLGREIEFFYDRRILGFDSARPGRRLRVGARARSPTPRSTSPALRQSAAGRARRRRSRRSLVGAACSRWLLCAASSGAGRRLGSGDAGLPRAARGCSPAGAAPVAPSMPPAEVARLFAEEVPAAREDAAPSSRSTARAPSEARAAARGSSRSLSERCGGCRKLA